MTTTSTTRPIGDAAEARALTHLVASGLRLVARNYRVTRGPRAGGGEVDLIMRGGDGTLVFVEVRARHDARHGGAAASFGATKRPRLVFAASHYLRRFAAPPPCRLHVVSVEDYRIELRPAAFDASAG
jgi:putative endonuclease